MIKALYEAIHEKIPPKTHNLVALLNTIELDVPEEELKTIESLNDISVVTRYPEDIRALIKAFKKDRVEDYLKQTKRLLKWFKKDKRLKK
jgi:HEPN domain-containing protein